MRAYKKAKAVRRAARPPAQCHGPRAAGPGAKQRSVKATDLSALLALLLSLEKNKKDGELPLPNGDTVRVTNLAKPFWPSV